MKKVTLLFAIAGLVFSIEQCRKPDLSMWNNGYSSETSEITFTTGDNSKGDIDEIDNALQFKWESDDVLYVYSSDNGEFGDASKYCGKLYLISGSGQKEGVFYGGLKYLPKNGGTLRVFYFGSGVTESAGVATAEIDLSEQNGNTNGLKYKICSYVDVPYNKGQKTIEGKLVTQFAIIRMDFSGFGNCDVTMNGLNYNKLRISATGEIQRNEGQNSILKNVTTSSENYYVAVITGSTDGYFNMSAKFTGNKREGGCVMGIKDNKLFYLENGASVKVDVRPEGSLPGLFSIGDGKQVRFSKGNLQYLKDNSSWKFAENQYDIFESNKQDVGDSYKYCNIVSLFSWGTSGCSHGATCYQPFSTTLDGYEIPGINEKYYAYDDYTKNLYDSDGSAEWGYNAISNGCNTTNMWRTLKQDEWHYLLFSREGYSNLYGEGKVGEISGIIFLPDNWECPKGIAFTPGINAFADNIYDTQQWSLMEMAGAVFLPAAGSRNGQMVYVKSNQGEGNPEGNYWESTVHENGNAHYFYFNELHANAQGNNGRQYGFSVRLVVDVVPDGTGSASPFGSGNW